MKKALLFLSLLWAATSQAQTAGRIPAWQVKVNTNGFGTIPGTQSNTQTVIDWIDDNMATTAYVHDAVSGLMKGTNIIGASYSNSEWTINSQTAGLLKGTNIIGNTYDSNTLQWTAMPGTNIVGATYQNDTNGNQWVISDTAQIRTNGNYFVVTSAGSGTAMAQLSTWYSVTNFTVVDGHGFSNDVFTAGATGLYLFVVNSLTVGGGTSTVVALSSPGATTFVGYAQAYGFSGSTLLSLDEGDGVYPISQVVSAGEQNTALQPIRFSGILINKW